MIKLGVNIDHIATLRQARRESFPSPVEAALDAVAGGATGITAHLREDRRHIQDRDIIELKENLEVPLNMEMAVSADILRVALRVKPAWVCLVPEKRQELTTEGGLDVKRNFTKIKNAIARLHQVETKVSLFIDPSVSSVDLAKKLAADAIEIHTGTYARLWPNKGVKKELAKILAASQKGLAAGLLVNAGHGIDYDNVQDLKTLFPFNEFNIGFAIVARAVSGGLESAVRDMNQRMNS